MSAKLPIKIRKICKSKSIEKHNSYQYQSAFRLLAASTKTFLEQDIGDLWDSGIQKQKCLRNCRLKLERFVNPQENAISETF